MRQKVSVAVILYLVVSGLAPRWVAKPPQNQATRFFLEECACRIRTASPPSAGGATIRQARSLQMSLAKTKQALGIIMSRILFW